MAYASQVSQGVADLPVSGVLWHIRIKETLRADKKSLS
jgi:hypothetical protein